MPIPPNSHLKTPPGDDLPIMDRSNAAGLLARGLARFFAAHGLVSLPEFTLRCGRRADLFCLDAKCRITIVEIKSSIEDFRCDQKWPDYLDYCDRFYFAVPQSFPQALIPPQQGLMVADGYGATVIRESGDLALNGARRRALLLQFAQLAALRLQAFHDPQGAGGRLESH
ncbi:MAG TPA: MmcB family DNA repair protein [Kiloniellaceae bacterium]